MRKVGLILLIAAAGCSKDAVQAPPPPKPPLVKVSKPVRRDIVQFFEATGRMQAIASVEVPARVLGFLQEMNFEPGTRVKKDQILFVIEKDDYEAQRDQAVANVAASEAEQEKAKSDLERFEEALKSNAVSKVQVTQAKAELLRSDAAVLSAKALLRRAALSLSYCDVRSPIDGLVGRNLIDVGNLVGPGDTKPLTTVVSRVPIFCYFEIPEQFVNEALVRQAAKSKAEKEGRKRKDTIIRIALPHEKNFPHEGYIDWADNTVDEGTGTLRARGVFENKEMLLYSGVFARVRIILDTVPNSILVKYAALSIDLGGRYLLIVGENDVVERRYVKLGQIEGEEVVITDGLDGSESYISDGLIRARPGLPVRTQDAAAAESDKE